MTAAGHTMGDGPTTARTVSADVAEVAASRSGATFGLMGNGNAYLVGHLTATGAPYVQMRHEAGTVAAAQAYALTAGRTATATTTYGAGFTNALTALAEARMARVPLVLITGEGPSTGMRWWDVDIEALAAGLGVPLLRVRSDDAAATAQRAYDVAERDRIPVVLAIPCDLATTPVPQGAHDGGGHLPPEPVPHPDAAEVCAVAEALVAAQRPLILLGRGAHLCGASADLRRIGDRLGALFATSAMAGGAVDSPWDVGIAGGFSTPAGWDLITAADVVLTVGISLNTFQDQGGRLLGGAREVIQVDLAARATNEQVTRYVRADAAVFAHALREELGLLGEGSGTRTGTGAPAAAPSSSGTWRARAPHAAGDLRADLSGLPDHAPDGRLDPRVVARRLADLLPDDRALVHDGGQFIGWMAQHALTRHPGELIMVGTALQTIGLGSASAVGAARARPERTTVLVTGDGGGQMGLADLPTFLAQVTSGVVVVFNDAAYGAELHQYGARGVHVAGMLLEEVDFAALGRALGAQGQRVTHLADLDVLGQWVEAGARGVLVLDLVVSRMVVADFLK